MRLNVVSNHIRLFVAAWVAFLTVFGATGVLVSSAFGDSDLKTDRSPADTPHAVILSQAGQNEMDSVWVPAVKDDISQESVVVKQFVFTGNSIVDTNILINETNSFLSQKCTMAQLQEVLEKIEVLYFNQGYIVAKASLVGWKEGMTVARVFPDGVVKIAISEGIIGKIECSGNTYFKDSLIKKYFDPRKEHVVLHKSRLKTGLGLTRYYSPHLEVEKVVLKKSDEPGKTDIELVAKDEIPIDFSIDYNNYGSPYLSEDRFAASFSVTDPIWGHEVSVRGVTGGNVQDSGLITADYNFPVLNYGTRIGGGYLQGLYYVGQEFNLLRMEGYSEMYSAYVVQPVLPLIKEEDTDCHIKIGYDRKYTKNKILGELRSIDELQAFDVEFKFEKFSARLANLHWKPAAWFLRKPGKSFVYATGTFGKIDTVHSAPHSRLDPSHSFERFNLEAMHIQAVSIPRKVYLLGRASGQWSDDRLLPTEQVVIGGYGSVRGQEVSTFMGDSGYTVSAELMFAPPFLHEKVIHGRALGKMLQLALFADSAGVFTNDPQLLEVDNDYLTGCGGGIRLFLGQRFRLKFDVAFPIGRAEGDDWFGYFETWFSF